MTYNGTFCQQLWTDCSVSFSATLTIMWWLTQPLHLLCRTPTADYTHPAYPIPIYSVYGPFPLFCTRSSSVFFRFPALVYCDPICAVLWPVSLHPELLFYLTPFGFVFLSLIDDLVVSPHWLSNQTVYCSWTVLCYWILACHFVNPDINFYKTSCSTHQGTNVASYFKHSVEENFHPTCIHTTIHHKADL